MQRPYNENGVDRRRVLQAGAIRQPVLGRAAHTDEALTPMLAECLDQGDAGFEPIQVLGRIAVPIRRSNPGKVQQMGGPQRGDHLLGSSRRLEVEIVPDYPVGGAITTMRPTHRVNAQAMSDQRLRAMAPKKSGAAGGEDSGGPGEAGGESI